MSGFSTTQKILRVGYFWPYTLRDYLTVVWKFQNCQIYVQKKCAHPSPLHPIIVVSPFSKWGIDFLTYNPHSTRGHGYIILAVDYFKKWFKAIPTYKEDGETTSFFVFNHIISRFIVPQAIITDHDRNFRNYMMTDITTKLGMCHDSSTRYYPWGNGQVEVVNKVLTTMIKWIIRTYK